MITIIYMFAGVLLLDIALRAARIRDMKKAIRIARRLDDH